MDSAFQAGVPEFAIGASAAACLIVWLGLMVNYGSTDTLPVRAQLKDVIQVIGRTDKTILSENPLVPILAGQQPYLIDPFSFRLMLEKRPSLGEPMWQMLHERRFRCRGAHARPNSDEGRDFYAGTHFGQGFMERLQQDYELAGTPEASTFICRAEALASEMTIGLLQTRSTSFATGLRAENSILLNHVKKWRPSNDRVSRL